MWIKICGIRDVVALEAALEAGVNAIGFVMVPNSRRYVTPSKVKELSSDIPTGIWKVGVFRGQPEEEILEALEESHLDTIQLHDYGDLDLCRRLRASGFRVIRSFGIPSGSEPYSQIVSNGALARAIEEFAATPCFLRSPGTRASWGRGSGSGSSSGSGASGSGADNEGILILLDTWSPAGSGGLGISADHDIAATIVRRFHDKKIILAGGLKPSNVADAIAKVKPWGVDVSSGVEIDGRKDPGLIRDFVATAKKAFKDLEGENENGNTQDEDCCSR